MSVCPGFSNTHFRSPREHSQNVLRLFPVKACRNEITFSRKMIKRFSLFPGTTCLFFIDGTSANVTELCKTDEYNLKNDVSDENRLLKL